MIEQKIKYKNRLKKLILQISIHNGINEKINLLNRINEEYEFNEYHHMVQHCTELLKKNQEIIDNIKKIIERIDNEIKEIVDFQNNIDPNSDVLPSAPLVMNARAEALITSHLNRHSQDRYPGLQFTFRTDTNFIHSMVSSDPLYIAGPTQNSQVDYLEDMINHYPEVYQRRVRIYGISNRNLDVLPQAQFGLILYWNFFNFQTLSTIEIYLSKIFKLLRPGGVLIFSYNNCELIESARQFDQQSASYGTKSSIKNIISSIGFEVLEIRDIKTSAISYCSWMEVRRPGILTTIKLAQARGLIGRK